MVVIFSISSNFFVFCASIFLMYNCIVSSVIIASCMQHPSHCMHLMHFVVSICGGFIAFVGQIVFAMHILHCWHRSLFICGGRVVVICPSFWSTGTTIRGISPFPDCAATFVTSVSAIP